MKTCPQLKAMMLVADLKMLSILVAAEKVELHFKAQYILPAVTLSLA